MESAANEANEGANTEQQAPESEEMKAEAESEEEKDQANASAMLEKELKSLQKDKRLFYNVETNCKV